MTAPAPSEGRSIALRFGRDADERRDLLVWLVLTVAGLALTLPMVLTVAVMGDPIMTLWMGPDYRPGVMGVVLAAGLFLSLALRPVQMVLLGLNLHGRLAIAQLLGSQGLTVARRALSELPDASCEVYLADTLGELGLLYKLAPVAFIGGSLVDRGGHNPIEAVRLGAMVLTGPHWQNFADTYGALIGERAAVAVRSAEELADAAARLLADAAELAAMRTRAEAVLADLSGALPRTVAALLRHLPGDELARAC